MDTIISTTIEKLSPLITKPKITEKYLGKPPFRYLFDIFCSFRKSFDFATEIEFPDTAPDDKAKKTAFLDQTLVYLAVAVGHKTESMPFNISVSRILSGAEADKTCIALQNLALFLDTTKEQRQVAAEAVNKGLTINKLVETNNRSATAWRELVGINSIGKSTKTQQKSDDSGTDLFTSQHSSSSREKITDILNVSSGDKYNFDKVHSTTKSWGVAEQLTRDQLNTDIISHKEVVSENITNHSKINNKSDNKQVSLSKQSLESMSYTTDMGKESNMSDISETKLSLSNEIYNTKVDSENNLNSTHFIGHSDQCKSEVIDILQDDCCDIVESEDLDLKELREDSFNNIDMLENIETEICNDTCEVIDIPVIDDQCSDHITVQGNNHIIQPSLTISEFNNSEYNVISTTSIKTKNSYTDFPRSDFQSLEIPKRKKKKKTISGIDSSVAVPTQGVRLQTRKKGIKSNNNEKTAMTGSCHEVGWLLTNVLSDGQTKTKLQDLCSSLYEQSEEFEFLEHDIEAMVLEIEKWTRRQQNDVQKSNKYNTTNVMKEIDDKLHTLRINLPLATIPPTDYIQSILTTNFINLVTN